MSAHIRELQRLLIVSPRPLALGPLRAVGRTDDYPVDTAERGWWEALEQVQSGNGAALIALELVPGDSSACALQTLRWLRRVRPDLPIVVLAYREDSEQRQEALRLGAQDYLLCPAEVERLHAILRDYIPTGAEGMERKLEPAPDEIEQIGEDIFFIASSPAMRKVRAQAELLAQVDAPLIIVGEPGSGKEWVARLIHKLSGRSDLRFLKVNCAALPGDLLDSELFGQDHALAANGRAQPGKFEFCDGVTLFLEQVTELPMGLQTKLLRMLQNRRVQLRHEGGVDFEARILAGTDVSIQQAVAEGRFRQDLYHRLSFALHVPPLRQRNDDIPLLVGHFMNQLSRRYGLPTRAISPAMLEACQSYSWPGNLVELENLVKCYLAIGNSGLVPSRAEQNAKGNAEMITFPLTVESPDISSLVNAELNGTNSGLKALVQSAKGVTERNAIVTALSTTHWNRKAAARLLKVSYRTLLYKIEHYRMSAPPENDGQNEPALEDESPMRMRKGQV